MSKPAPTGVAADFRARLGGYGIMTPLKAASDAPGYLVDARGNRVLAVNAKGLDLDGERATKAAADLATAINWYAGQERKA